MWYEKDFTIPIFCKTVEFKQLYDLGLYNGKFEVSKDQAEKIVNIPATSSIYAAIANVNFFFIRSPTFNNNL